MIQPAVRCNFFLKASKLYFALLIVGLPAAGQIADGIQNVTIVSNEVGVFDYGDQKRVLIFENSRNLQFENNPERWRFAIEPILVPKVQADGTIEYQQSELTPIKIPKNGYPEI